MIFLWWKIFRRLDFIATIKRLDNGYRTSFGVLCNKATITAFKWKCGAEITLKFCQCFKITELLLSHCWWFSSKKIQLQRDCTKTSNPYKLVNSTFTRPSFRWICLPCNAQLNTSQLQSSVSVIGHQTPSFKTTSLGGCHANLCANFPFVIDQCRNIMLKRLSRRSDMF